MYTKNLLGGSELLTFEVDNEVFNFDKQGFITAEMNKFGIDIFVAKLLGIKRIIAFSHVMNERIFQGKPDRKKADSTCIGTLKVTDNSS